ncbi:TauD/TfdA family dioxygenase [Streptomyces sp. NPDC093109]|uniref:TauD/TfdA family dioxygenase n=1 Tax=Streptomyces sp. NPDC093109 TaxID=3154977 RepID=UPI00344D94DF
MRGAITQPPDPPAAHRVAATSTASAPDDAVVAARLRETGLVMVDGLFGRSAVLTFAARFMTVVPHRDSDPDGLTTIRHTRRHGDRPGFAGFGSGELAAHTEGSAVPVPPRLMLLVCERDADVGGECLLTDGRAVHAELLAQCPDAVAMLSGPRTVYFGAGNGHLSQVFTAYPGGRVSVRLRQDGLARWSPLVSPYVPYLREAVARHQHTVRLSSGQAYLLDNRRWLHARTEFRGERRFLRALGEPRLSLPEGFTVAPEAGGVLSTAKEAA